jgi:hypothetical protein
MGCPQKFVTLWRTCAGAHRRNTGSLAILKIRGPLFCILNTFTAVIAAYFARRLAAYIKFMSQQAVTIGC